MPALPENVWFPMKMLFDVSCGILVVSRLSVTEPLVPPPVRSCLRYTRDRARAFRSRAHPRSPVPLQNLSAGARCQQAQRDVALGAAPAKPAPAVTPLIGPGGPAGPVNTMFNSAGWLVVVVSLLFRANETAPSGTIAMPSLAVPFNQSTAAAVTSTRTYLFLSPWSPHGGGDRAAESGRVVRGKSCSPSTNW